MDLNKLIALAILAAVGTCLVLLIRRLARDHDAAPRGEDALTETEMSPTPVPVEAPLAGGVVPASVEVLANDAVSSAIVVAVEEPATKAKRQKAPKPLPTTSAQTPVVRALELLKTKDSLAVAFTLGEILAPPLSRR